MGIIILLITISILIAVLFLGIFYWNIKSGQYDDTYTPSVRMLFDDTSKKSDPVGEIPNVPRELLSQLHSENKSTKKSE